MMDTLYEKNGDLVFVETSDRPGERLDLGAKVVYFGREIRECLRKLGEESDQVDVDG